MRLDQELSSGSASFSPVSTCPVGCLGRPHLETVRVPLRAGRTVGGPRGPRAPGVALSESTHPTWVSDPMAGQDLPRLLHLTPPTEGYTLPGRPVRQESGIRRGPSRGAVDDAGGAARGLEG